jgi:putative ABC transport system substrate-binding protein
MPFAADDPQARLEAFLKRLQEIRMDRRPQCADRLSLDPDNPGRGRAVAAELVALAPDVVLTATGTLVSDLQNASRTVPIVFAAVADAVRSGRVENAAILRSVCSVLESGGG